MEVKSCLNTASVKFPVTSRPNQPYLKCKYKVAKYAKIRCVIPVLTFNAKMVG